MPDPDRCPHCGRPHATLPPQEPKVNRTVEAWLLLGVLYALGLGAGGIYGPGTWQWALSSMLVFGLLIAGLGLFVWAAVSLFIHRRELWP